MILRIVCGSRSGHFRRSHHTHYFEKKTMEARYLQTSSSLLCFRHQDFAWKIRNRNQSYSLLALLPDFERTSVENPQEEKTTVKRCAWWSPCQLCYVCSSYYFFLFVLFFFLFFLLKFYYYLLLLLLLHLLPLPRFFILLLRSKSSS